jgi:hypothetical protein
MSDKVRGVAGDPIFFELIEASTVDDIEEEGLRADGPHVLDWRYPAKMRPKADDVRQALANPIETDVVKIAVFRNPPKDVFEAAVTAAGEQVCVVYETDHPRVSMKSEAMKRLEEEGLVYNAGYIQNTEDPRFPKIVQNICELHSLDVPLDVVDLIAARVPRVQVQSKSFLNTVRIRNEMIKAQTLAGFDKQVTREDVRNLLPPLDPSVWDLIDAVFNRNLDGSLTVVSGLDDEQVSNAIYALADEFMVMLLVIDAHSRFSGADDIAKDLAKPAEVFGLAVEDAKPEGRKIHRYRIQKSLNRMWDWKRSAIEAIKICENAVSTTRRHPLETRYQLCKTCVDICQLPK